MGPGKVRRDKELDIPVPEDTQDHPPQIPLRETAPTLKQLGRGLLLTRLVLRPGIASISTRLKALVVAILLPSFVWRETREYEDRFDVEFFEHT